MEFYKEPEPVMHDLCKYIILEYETVNYKELSGDRNELRLMRKER